jgi:phosphate transport system permease protein
MKTETAPAPFTGSRGARSDETFRWLMRCAGAAVLIVLVLMIATTSIKAWPVFAKEGLHFLTGTKWLPGTSRTGINGTYGALPFIYGTLVTSVLALVIAVPLSIGVALCISELAGPRVKRPLAYAVDLLAAVPSVIYGLWGVLFFVPYVLKPVMDFLARSLGRVVPLFAPPVVTVSYFSAGVVLAIMILPIIAAIGREVFAALPDGERQGAYALGATRWEVISRLTVPRSAPGLIGASMLGLGRALGETIAVALLIGGSITIDHRLFHPGYTIAALIANTFQESAPEAIRALIAIGVTLFAITVVVNAAARSIVRRIERSTPKAAV